MVHIHDKIKSLPAIEKAVEEDVKNGAELVIVDHVGLIDSSMENRNSALSQISRALHLMAVRLNVPIVALSQLSRATETRDNHKPRISDLRDSGALEQDADYVILLYRDDMYQYPSPDAGIIELTLAKNRHGETATIKAGWAPNTATVANIDMN